MAYIGKTPITGNFVKLDAISVVNGQAGYTMNNGGSAFTDYENVNQFLVSLNGILQAPTTSFTVSGSTLTFASNLATGDVIDFVIVLGNTLDIGTPSDATVTQAKTNFVSTSSAAGLQIKGDGTTDGTLQLNCSQNSHGVKLKSPAHSSAQSYTLTLPATAPQADKALITDGSGNLSFGDAGGGKVLQVVQNVDTNSYSTTSSSFVTDSGSTGVSITPSATSSKIYVIAMFGGEVVAGKGRYTFFRDSSNIYTNYLTTAQNVNQSTSSSMHYLDSPSTTSQINYKIAVKSNTGGEISYVLTPITIIAMEIGV
tara:strand:- start:234 stop:1169 length:936 start_codon:yes stop_codon:yes gene_type:complete